MEFVKVVKCRHCLLRRAPFILGLSPFLAPAPEMTVFDASSPAGVCEQQCRRHRACGMGRWCVGKGCSQVCSLVPIQVRKDQEPRLISPTRCAKG